MQKRNVAGIEKVIFLLTKRMEEEAKGPKGVSNKSAVALARLLGAYSRSVRGNGRKNQQDAGMTEAEKQEYLFEHGDRNFYDSLTGKR